MKVIIVNSPKHGEKHILVDDEDYEMLSKRKWYIVKKGNKTHDLFYAASHDYKNGKRFTFRMHRFILGIDDPEVLVDHKDCNGLNNQKRNLRTATISQNCMNKRAYGRCGYLGVCIDERQVVLKDGSHRTYRYFKATIGVGGKTLNLGNFKTEIEAAIAYDEAAKIHHKEFARLNFPSPICYEAV